MSTWQTSSNSSLVIRYTELEDGPYLRQWLLEPTTSRGFPMSDVVEVDDATNRWVALSRYKCSLTAVYDGVPCGLTTLYLQPYKTLAHQCEFGIIVGADYRGRGVGEELLNAIIALAKDPFRIEVLHLTVLGDNPAMRLYRRFGFREFGRQARWRKDEHGIYTPRVFMEKYL